MKKTILFLLFAWGACFAQEHGGKHHKGGHDAEEVKAMMKEHLKKNLALTEAQEKNFWPIYDAYIQERKAGHKKMRALKSGLNVKPDDQLEKDLQEILTLKSQEVEQERKYFDKFKTVISMRQLAELYRTEQYFKQKMIERMGQQGGDF